MGKSAPRLAESFKPENYKLSIEIDSKKMCFKGTVVIEGQKIGRPAKRITFHQKDLKIISANVIKQGKSGEEAVDLARINSHKSFDEVRLHSSSMFYPGKYTVEIKFSGRITEQMHGLYPCNYRHGGKNKKLFATQFESHHAREVFPCIDEPEAKATFDLSLFTPVGETVLSNTPVLEQKEVDSLPLIVNRKKQKTTNKKLQTSFETTPVMSTYLLAFAVGEIHCVKSKTKDGIEVSSWATVAQDKTHLEYANKEAVDVLEFFTDYFKTPFPLKKLDQIALPDFDSMAMENWGLITYREIGLLADPVNRSQSGEQLISLVVSHEISHQWFGNLVTMKWWDDLWLNESFASIMEYVCLDALHPDWHMWENFAEADMIAASNRDVTSNVQAVKTKVNHPDELFTLFDPSIVYAKGARLIKMMYDFIGEEAIRTGLKSYFKEFAYKNTVSDDLWRLFSKTSGQDVKELMDPWLTQSGMPLLNISRNGSKLNVVQKRFLLDENNDKQTWPIPLLANKKLPVNLMQEEKLTLELDKDEPVVFNRSGSTHAVVNYESDKDKKYLQKVTSTRKIDSVGRMNLFNDAYLLSRHGSESLSETLELVENCASEDRDSVWQLMLRPLGAAKLFLEGDEKSEQTIKQIKLKLSKQHFKNLGWDDRKSDSPNTKALRVTMTALMLQSEDNAVVEEALSRYKKAAAIAELPSEQRSLILATAVKNKKADLDKVFEEYVSTNSSDVQRSITAGLTTAKDTESIKKILEKSIGKDEVVRVQDIPMWFAYLMRNQYSRESAWEWLVKSWPELTKKFDGNKSLDRFVIYSAGPLCTTDYEKKFSNFFDGKSKEVAIGRPITIAKGEIKARVAWRERELSSLKKHFSKV
ncbi:MAG: M1 family metallopeptidase [Candidatus Saccharimonadales bacterium]